MEISELYKARAYQSNRIKTENVKSLADGVTIKNVEIVGSERKGVLLTFEETDLKHKCNRTDVLTLAKNCKSTETNDFVGCKVDFVISDEKVRIAK